MACMTRVGSDKDERSVDEENVYNKKTTRLYILVFASRKREKDNKKREGANTQWYDVIRFCARTVEQDTQRHRGWRKTVLLETSKYVEKRFCKKWKINTEKNYKKGSKNRNNGTCFSKQSWCGNVQKSSEIVRNWNRLRMEQGLNIRPFHLNAPSCS